MKKKIEKILLLIGMCLIMLLSCEMKAPVIPDNGSILYQKPKSPENLKATRGYKDSITLTWDAVENAALYKIYGSEASDFGTLKLMGTSTTNRFVLKKNTTPSVAINPDQSYIFTVRSVTFFDNTSDSLESLNSNYAEGTLAPSKISLHAVVTDNYVDAYWNSSNIFSAWNSSYNPEMLYKAKFYLSYQQVGSSEDAVVIDENNTDNTLPWQYKRIDINRAGMQQEENYLFCATMDILDENDAVIATVKSDEVKIAISSSKITTPIAKADITVSNDKYDRINIKWIVPQWTEGVSPENALFKIERSVAGANSWSVLVDEIGTAASTSAFKLEGYDKDRMVMSYDDTTAEKDVIYEYRITNAAKDSYGTIYQHDASALEVSNPGSIFVPANPNVTVSDTKDSPIKYTIEFNMSSVDLKGNPLSFVIVREIMHYDTNKTDKDIIHSFAVDEKYIQEEKLIDCEECSRIKHTYKYRLQLVESSGAVLTDYGYIQKDGSDYEITFDIQDVFDATSLVASENLLNKIDLKWKEEELPDSLISYITYYYSLDGVNDIQITLDDSSRPNMSCTIVTEDNSVSEVTLKACIDGVCISSASKTTSIYKMQPVETSFDDKTRVMTFRWNHDEHLENLVYKFEYKQKDSTSPSWKIIGTVKYEEGRSSIDFPWSEILSNSNELYQIRYSVWDKSEPDNVVYVNSDAGYAYITDLNFYLNYGESLNTTTLYLDDNKYSIKKCKFYLFDGANISSADLIKEFDSNSGSVQVADITEDKKYFAYSLVYEDNGITYYTQISTNSSKTEDKYGEMVERNTFIPFDNVSSPILTVNDVDTKAGGISTEPYNAYLEFKWKKTYGASSYDITVVGDGDNITPETKTVNVDELLHNEGKSESGTPNSVGYLSYDKTTGEYTYLSDVGILKRTLTFKDFKIVGHNSNKELSSGEGTYTSPVGLHRTLKAVEVINLINNVLSKELVKANTQFSGDWWPPTSASIKAVQYIYPSKESTDISIKSTIGGSLSYTSKDDAPGTISFNNYKENVYNLMSFTTSEAIKIDIKNGGGKGYLDTDPLETLGYDNVGLLNITIDRMPAYSLKYKDVKKSNKNGSYDVTVNGTTTNIADSDDLVSVFEGL